MISPATGLEVLRLGDFRSFAALEFRPGPRLNFIVGANGQGKTTILEAAALLLRLQSPRTSSPGDCVRFGASQFLVEGNYRQHSLRVSFTGRLRRAWLNGKPPASLAEYLTVGRVVWISNGDRELVTGGSAVRRRFLDFLGSQTVPGYLQNLRAYERALRSRNFLLREARPRREVAAFDEVLLGAGEFLLSARPSLVRDLAPWYAQAHRQIADAGELEVIYQPGAQQPFPLALENSRSEEERLRTTIVGPHRDDLALFLEGKSAATFASEGQQRSMALALKIAQAQLIAQQYGSPPLCLLDDIFGELDPARRNNLLLALPAEAQSLITATSLDWMRLRPSEALVFHLEHHSLHAVRD